MSNYTHILIAVDFSDSAHQVIRRAKEIISVQSTSITLLHVVEHLPPMDFGYEPITTPDWYGNEQEVVKRAEEKLNELATQYGIDTACCTVALGNPRHEIIENTKQNQADLIVIGSHGRHGIQRLLGSTVYPVLNNAECDVLAVRIN